MSSPSSSPSPPSNHLATLRPGGYRTGNSSQVHLQFFFLCHKWHHWQVPSSAWFWKDSQLTSRQFSETSYRSGTAPFCLATCQQAMELVQVSPPKPRWLQGILRGSLLSSGLGWGLPQAFTHGQETQRWGEPSFRTSSLVWTRRVNGWTSHPISFTCHPSWWVPTYKKQEFTW